MCYLQAHTFQETNRALMARQYVDPSKSLEEATAEAAILAVPAATGTALDAEGVVAQLAEALGCAAEGSEILLRLLPQQQQRLQLLAMQVAAEASRQEAAAALALSQTHLEDMRAGGRLTTQSQLDLVQVSSAASS